MASDEIVWQIINQQFCAFKLKTTKDQTFCRNEYNVTGLCSRQSCPLANSRYATVRSSPTTGHLYLFTKTIERAHLPSQLWERTRLSAASYADALSQIDEKLKYWPKFLIHKCKQRLTRLTQVAIRSKRLAKEQRRLGETTVAKLAPKLRKREMAREHKAQAAAKVERAIERELIERLKSGAYGDKDRPLNVEEGVWKKVLKGLERAGEGKTDKDLDEGIEDENEFEQEEELEQEDGIGDVEYVSDIEGEDSEGEDDLGDLEDWLDGESAEEEGEESGDEDSASEAEDEEASEDKENLEKLKKALAGAKRRMPEKKGRAPKAPKRDGKKGPKREIEYELENGATARESLYA